MKKISEEEVVRRVAYEVSVSKLELINADGNEEENMSTYQILTI